MFVSCDSHNSVCFMEDIPMCLLLSKRHLVFHESKQMFVLMFNGPCIILIVV